MRLLPVYLKVERNYLLNIKEAFLTSSLFAYNKGTKSNRAFSYKDTVDMFNQVMAGTTITDVAAKTNHVVSTVHTAIYCYARLIDKEQELKNQIKSNSGRRRCNEGKRVPVEQYDLEGCLLNSFVSGAAAARYIGGSKTGLSQAISLQREYYGFMWKIKE